MSLIASGVVMVLLIAAFVLGWYVINNTFQGKLFYYRIYKVGSLGRNFSVDRDDWTKSEKTLGSDFKKFIPAMDRGEFENSKEYLKKAGDLGRSALPFWLIMVIGLLIIAEGAGFSFLLGTFIAPEGTADTANMLMVAIVLTLCVVLGFTMHAAGHQLHRTRLIANCRRDWLESRASHDKPFKTQEIGVHEDQHIDDAEPSYTQVVNRVGDHGSYTMVVIAVLTIIAIGFGSTYMRIKGMEKHLADETTGRTVVAQAASSGNPFAAAKSADGLPGDVTSANDKASERGAKESSEAGHVEALSAFAILAVIFIITQIVAIYAGFKWGFAGKESRAAHERTRGFASWTQVKEVKDAFIEPVEGLMGALHVRFTGRNRKTTPHTFKQFLSKSRREEADDEATTGVPPVAVSDFAAAPAAAAKPVAVALAAAPAGDAAHRGVQAHLDALDALESREGKQAYVVRQPQAVRDQVIAAIKGRKEAEASALKQVEGLF